MKNADITAPLDVPAELDRFEDAVVTRDYPLALRQLMVLLKASSVHRSQPDRVFDHLDREQAGYIATRFASAAFQLFLDDGFQLNEQGYAALQIYARNFATIIALTPFANADHVIRHIVGQSESGKAKDAITLYGFRKLLFLWSVYSTVILPFDRFMRQHPDLFKYLMFNALTLTCYTDPDADARRNELVGLLAAEDYPLTLDQRTLAFAGPVWMYTAYATHPAKHDAKITLNKAYRQWLLTHGISEPALPLVRARKDKPRIVVIVEQMTINHAVYRCYGKALQSLRQRFTVVGMGTRDLVDDEAIAIFDDFVYFDPGIAEDMKKNVGKVIKQKADIIIFLSLGMQNMTIPMATLRLAPIQICLPAHPTTTRMPTIDYMLLTGSVARECPEFQETLVLLPDGAFAFSEREGMEAAGALAREQTTAHDTDCVKVVLPAYAMKVNSALVQMLQRIQQRVSVRVEYHFAPYIRGISYLQFKEALEKCLPGCVVHTPYPYAEYLRMIAGCDLQITCFPFGNTNGNIDAALVGVPIITRMGDGVESRIDASMMARMGVPEWVVATSEQSYEDLAVELIDNPHKRAELAAAFQAVDLQQVFFSTHHETAFLDAIANIYQHHEQLQQSPGKKWDWQELAALAP